MGLGENGAGIKQNKKSHRHRQQYGDYQKRGWEEVEEGEGG